MDNQLRALERKALITGNPMDVSNYLNAAYRAGLYRAPKRKEIIKILRNQVQRYRGRRKLQPRFYAPPSEPRFYAPLVAPPRHNQSHLQHPDEVSTWDGSYLEWEEALQMAMPGDVFEVSVYLLSSQGGSLDTIITLSVPPLITKLGDSYYGPPEGPASILL